MGALKEKDEEEKGFVEVTNSRSIQNILRTIYNSRECVSAFQITAGESKNTVGFFFDYQKKSEYIDFKSMELKKGLGFDKDKEVFFHSDFRTTIFKSKIKSANSTKLKISFPTTLRIEETREGGRVRLGLKSNLILNIYLYTENYDKIKVSCQILDYSEGGVGLLVPIEFAPFLNLHQIIEIGESHIDILSKKYFSVRSLSPLENVLSGAKFIRVGGEFTE
ncbi:MAG: hypothetical protein CME70_12160 [Halobacteriovorax sp.]|nr:hypothetical protein [Halobacteriovorax sp.]|tara:strand:+ start:288063 stop:288725 length:663 start_codon:yes stop_codon:yes gene_type:complete